MIFWLFAGGLTAVALYAVLRPVLARDPDGALAAADYDVEVYRSQLAEIERDAARGQLSPEEAEAARAEIGRRLLDADRRRDEARADAGAGAGGWPRRLTPYAIAALLPGAAFGLYLELGQPGAPDRPLALRGEEIRQAEARRQAATGAAGQQGQSLDQAAAGLRQRLDRAPDDLEGWLLLARTEMQRGAFDAAVAAFERVRTLLPADAADQARAQATGALAEALVMAADGVVTPRAKTLFEQALERDPASVRAAYYLAEADRQAGRTQAALDRWLALAEAAPPGAPYLPAVNARARAAAEELGVDIAERLPQPTAPQPTTPPAATEPDGPADRAALKARVAANPMDFEAWVGLIRAQAEAGETEAARATLADARATFAEAPVPRRRLAQLADALGLAPGGEAAGGADRGPSQADIDAARDMSPEAQREMIAGMVDGLAARLEENPDDLEGWRMLARSYRVLGRPADSLAALERAQALAPDDIDLMILRARRMREIADGASTEESLTLMRRVRQRAPGNVEANWFLGRDALARGDRAEAEARFKDAVEALPEGSDRRATLRREADALLGDR